MIRGWMTSRRHRPRPRDLRPRCDPLVVGLELQTELVIKDPPIAVAIASDRFRRDRLHFLRHHADIEVVAAIIGEAIEAEAIVEPAEKENVVLKPYVGSPSAPPSETSASTAAASRCGEAETSAATAATDACSWAGSLSYCPRLRARGGSSRLGVRGRATL